jgi:hypothetical protein
VKNRFGIARPALVERLFLFRHDPVSGNWCSALDNPARDLTAKAS